MPSKHFYGPENMNPKVYEEFDKWYDEQAGKTFNFKEEVDKYCCSDVKVLAMGILKFKQFLLLAKIELILFLLLN